jgi:hypothetical protein
VHFETPFSISHTQSDEDVYLCFSFHNLDTRTKLHRCPNSIGISLFWQNLGMNFSPNGPDKLLLEKIIYISSLSNENLKMAGSIRY